MKQVKLLEIDDISEFVAILGCIRMDTNKTCHHLEDILLALNKLLVDKIPETKPEVIVLPQA